MFHVLLKINSYKVFLSFESVDKTFSSVTIKMKFTEQHTL